MSKQRGSPFQLGNNLGRGRPKGSRNKATAAAQELLNGYAEPILKKCISKALQGDQNCLRLCLERILPPLRDPVMKLPLPQLQGSESVLAMAQRILSAVSRGQITPSQAASMASTVETLARALHQPGEHGDVLEPKSVMPEWLAQTLIEAQGLVQLPDGRVVDPKYVLLGMLDDKTLHPEEQPLALPEGTEPPAELEPSNGKS